MNLVQASGYDHNQAKQEIHVSSLKIFDGEDLTQGDRKYIQEQQQRSWIEQQVYEKQQRSANEKMTEYEYAQHNKELAELRKQLETEHAQQRRQNEFDCKQSVRNQVVYKHNKESNDKANEQELNQQHINYLTNSDFMTENTQTCQSQLANHRVIPYHWKGMSEQQKKNIAYEQERQIAQKKEEQRLQQEEKRLWDLQSEQNRLKLIHLEREKVSRSKEVKIQTKEFNRNIQSEQKNLNQYY